MEWQVRTNYRHQFSRKHTCTADQCLINKIDGQAYNMFNVYDFFICYSQYNSIPVSVSNLGTLEQQDYWRVSATCPSLSHCQAIKQHRCCENLITVTSYALSRLHCVLQLVSEQSQESLRIRISFSLSLLSALSAYTSFLSHIEPNSSPQSRISERWRRSTI